jgi:hypothetical protein
MNTVVRFNKSNPVNYLTVLLLALFSITVIPTVHATTPNAQSIIYFDSQNNIIGQSIIDCHNYTGHAGNVNASNPYKIQEQWNCAPIGVICTAAPYSGVSGVCTSIPNPTYYTLEYFATATGATYDDYCAARPAGDFQFNGHPVCGQLGFVSELGPYQTGFN